MVVARLVCLVPLLAGCGRLGFDGFGDEPEPGNNMTTGVDDSSLSAPFACETIASFATLADADVDLAAATTPTGASLFWVPSSGGNLDGLELTTASRQPSPVTRISSAPYDQSSAAFVDGRLVVTGRNGIRAVVHDVPMPIGLGVEIANLTGDHTAKTAVAKAGADRVMAASCSEMALHAFDTSWVGTENTYTKSLTTSDHIEMTQLGTSALTTVSIDSGCDFELATSKNTSTTRLSPTFCKQARLATTGGTQVAMVVETPTTVDLVIDDVTTVTAGNAMPLALGSSPRVLAHGGRYWVSYLDESSNIVVGTVEDGIVLTSRLAGASALHDGFELVVYDGAPWVFAVDPASASVYGRKLCVPST